MLRPIQLFCAPQVSLTRSHITRPAAAQILAKQQQQTRTRQQTDPAKDQKQQRKTEQRRRPSDKQSTQGSRPVRGSSTNLQPVRVAETPSIDVQAQNYLRAQPDTERGRLCFEGERRFAQSTAEARAWLSELLHLANTSSEPVVVGFDTETPVTWATRADGSWGASSRKVALVQICYHPQSHHWPICLLVQISELGLTHQIIELLEHPNIYKVGIGIAPDLYDLQRDYDTVAACNPQGFVDLNWLAHKCGVPKPLSAQARKQRQQKAQQGIKTFHRRESWGLAGLLLHTTGWSLVKSSRVSRSNWAKRPLTAAQMDYACADAFASLLCCMALKMFWLQQQEFERDQEQLSLVQGQRQQQQQPLVADPLQMSLWSLSRGGSNKLRKVTSHLQPHWQAFMEKGCVDTHNRLAMIRSNALAKAEAEDHSDWQWGFFHEPSSARSGFQESPW